MFGLFKRKSKIEKLQLEYAQMMAEHHRLATVNRVSSDRMFARAEEIAREIDALQRE